MEKLVQIKTLYCSSCGKPVTEEDQFCTNCGQKLLNGDKGRRIQDQIPETKRFYNIFQVAISTFLGGPLCAGILMSKNFKVLGRKNASVITLPISIVFIIILLLLLALIPDGVNERTSYALPLIYTIITVFLFQFYQKEVFNAITSGEAKKQSSWKVFGVTLVGLIATAGLLLLIYGLLNSSLLLSFFQDDGIKEYNKGVEYYNTNQKGLAEQQYKLAIQKNPNLAEAYLSLGLIYLEDGWLEGAEEMTQRCVGLFKSSNETLVKGGTENEILSIAYNNLGVIEIRTAQNATGYAAYYTKDEWEKALEYFREAVRLDPTNSTARANLTSYSNAY